MRPLQALIAASALLLTGCVELSLLFGLPMRSGSFTFRDVEIEVNVDEEQVPEYTLPALMQFEDGRAVRTHDEWAARRAELLESFRAHVYGRTPTVDRAPLVAEIERDTPALGGVALRSQLRIFLLGEWTGPWMDLLLYRPAEGPARVPFFLGLNSWGNHSIHEDPEIRLAESWMRNDLRRGVRENRALERSRGKSASRWPIERILARGYGLATVYAGDLDPDFDDGFRNGLHAAFEPQEPRSPDAFGAVGAWAFGLVRAGEMLRELAGAEGVAVVGHSRLGKAALWAGAQSLAFELVVSNDSGCAGAALSRRRFGETVHTINALFPHWFAPRFASYGGREDTLPVDQHQLLALIAPARLYVASAAEDLWADPAGELAAARAAAPAFALLRSQGAPPSEPLPWQLPAPGTAIQGDIGYHLRSGAHDLTAEDWEHFLDYADARVWPTVRPDGAPEGSETVRIGIENP